MRKRHADLRTGSYAALLVCEPASGESVEITYASTENVGEIANNGNAENVTLPGDAAEVMLDKTFAYAPNADGTGYVVTGFGEEATAEDKTNAVIPATYSGKPVVEIADYAFQNQTALQSVTIPASVETIGEYAFQKTNNLQEVIFEEGSALTAIGNKAFALTNVENSASLKIEIPACVTKIGSAEEQDSGVFGYRKFSEISFAANSALTEIGTKSFSNIEYAGTLTIPASVETIGRSAFERSTITSIVFAEGSRLKDWREDTSEGFGYSVFSISNIESVRFAENSTFTVLPGRTFASCSALSAVYLPASVKTIGGAAFDGAENLQRIDDSGTLEILSGVTAIEVSAFKNCANLAGTVAFSNNIRVVSETAFRGCKKITGFTFRGSLLTEIGEGAFCDTGITSIALPASVKTIGVQAFMGTPLASVAIPASVTEIGESAFKYCKQLKEVTFAANSQLTSIGEDAFMGCSLLEDVSLENCTALTSIGCKAFNQCAALSSVIIPATVTQIDELGLYIGSETSPAAIYCYAEQGQKPSGWNDSWCREEAAVYWNGEWELQEDVPVPLNA